MLAFRPLARLAGLRQQAAACASHAKFSSSAAPAAGGGLEPVGPAEAAREQNMQSADTDYNATPQYPNQSPEDAGEAAAAASSAPLPSGPMDTSSVNDPAGRAEGSYQQQQNSMHIHHPGREADVAAAAAAGEDSGDSDNSGNSGGSPQQPHVVLDMFKQSGSGASGGGGGDTAGSGRQTEVDQDSFTAGSGGSSAAAARIDQPGSGPSGEGLEGPGNLNAGVEATNVIPGAERAMTADFAAGGDDVNPSAQQDDASPAAVNPSTGLPEMDGGGAGAGSSRFGGLENPDQVGEQGMTARQTEKSTGMDPGDLASG